MTDIMEAASSKYPDLAELAPNDIPYDERSSFSIWVNHRDSFTGVTDHDRAMTISEMAIMLKEERYGDFGKTFRSRTLLDHDRGRGLSVRHGDHIIILGIKLDRSHVFQAKHGTVRQGFQDDLAIFLPAC